MKKSISIKQTQDTFQLKKTRKKEQEQKKNELTKLFLYASFYQRKNQIMKIYVIYLRIQLTIVIKNYFFLIY